MTNRENVNTAESSGEENDEKNNANAVIMTNSSTMKYNARSTHPSLAMSAWCRETKERAAKTPMAMKNVFTASVPVSPKNFPAINSQRRTGRESTVYRVRLSISFET